MPFALYCFSSPLVTLSMKQWPPSWMSPYSPYMTISPIILKQPCHYSRQPLCSLMEIILLQRRASQRTSRLRRTVSKSMLLLWTLLLHKYNHKYKLAWLRRARICQHSTALQVSKRQTLVRKRINRTAPHIMRFKWQSRPCEGKALHLNTWAIPSTSSSYQPSMRTRQQFMMYSRLQ